jgi:hypothetical protein
LINYLALVGNDLTKIVKCPILVEEIAFDASSGLEPIGLSFWNEGADAEVYGQQTYREVMGSLKKVIEGTPRIGPRDVLDSNFHKIPPHVAP